MGDKSLNMKRYIEIATVLIVLLVASCGPKSGNEKVEVSAVVRKFPMVNIPTMIQQPQEAAEYLASHYWEAFLSSDSESGQTYLCDSVHVAGVPIVDFEQSLANYIYILESVPLKNAQKAVSQLADKVQAYESADTSSNVFETFVQMAEKYLFDPNSPLRNEDLYSPFSASLSVSPHLDPATRDRYAYVTKMCRLNEKGTIAADFRFCDRRGKEYTLHSINTPLTLLFFSNPGCESCFEIINMLKNDRISRMIADKKLSVLNIYIDEDLQAWREYMPIYPKEWYNGFDPDMIIRSDKIYNVRAIPSLYLLDSDKKVLMKDATPERLFDTIERFAE